jgi:hypothetical protein
MFSSPIDIANRACQHCGVTRIKTLDDDSTQAGEISFVYDKVRRAELRRNVWRFSIKHAALRPIQTGTMHVRAPLWAPSTTYGFGAIVADSGGVLWQSLAQDNLNNQLGGSPVWDAYTGPLTVSPFDNTGGTGYFSGEMVYETPGDGTYSVYMSLQSGNSQDPRAPSQWLSTVQYALDQVALFYPAWAIGTTYAAGAVAMYLGYAYVSLAGSNTGNNPATASAKWTLVPTALAPNYYNSTTPYYVGNFVTYLGLNYVCIAVSTGNLPTVTAYWAPQAIGTTYVSLIDFNLNNDPSASPSPWNSVTSYSIGNKVGGSNRLIYTSVTNANLANDPVVDNGTNWTNSNVLTPWTTVNNFGFANTLWLQLAVGLTDINIVYPVGSGPADQSETRNVFRLPAGFLRRAPQDPKAGSVSFLGAPVGLAYDDWNLEGNYLVSCGSTPILLRFVADVTDVTKFDDMFCEGLGARVGMEVCERVTQSVEKKASIQASYNKIMGDARTVNGIETGSVEPPEDSYISCRM